MFDSEDLEKFIKGDTRDLRDHGILQLFVAPKALFNEVRLCDCVLQPCVVVRAVSGARAAYVRAAESASTARQQPSARNPPWPRLNSASFLVRGR